jgi:DNA invertase Pin-like site-specific DNA recombinase
VSLQAKGVDLFLHQQGLDTSTPSGRAMFQMLGVFDEFERAMIRERVMAGLSRAKADGIQLGRRRLEATDADKVAAIMAARARGRVTGEEAAKHVAPAFRDAIVSEHSSFASQPQ